MTTNILLQRALAKKFILKKKRYTKHDQENIFYRNYFSSN